MTEPCRPFARETLDAEAWVAALADHPGVELLALWADTQHAHALLRHDDAIRVISVAVASGRYPALSPHRPAATDFERMIADLWGHAADGALDRRAILDHGRWPNAAPLSPKPVADGRPSGPPELLVLEDDRLHQLPLGPVRDGIAEPVHLRVHASGERMVRLEARRGYAHTGTLALMRGKSPRAAARYASRLAGDSTVAHAIAFARAAEAATGTEAPPRAAVLRGVMAELERIAGHLFDLAAIAGAAGAAIAAGPSMRLREHILGAAASGFESRAMMDAVAPGGVAVDLAAPGMAAILRAANQCDAALPGLRRSWQGQSTLADRLRGVGRVSVDTAARYAPGGVIGRAAGRAVDLRSRPGYAPYPSDLGPTAASAAPGDALARATLRLDEIGASVALIRTWLAALPAGPVSVALPMASGEGIGFAEGPRGDVWHWMRLDGGLIASVFMRDPAWLHWPLLEVACAASPLDDLGVIEASFGCSVSGVDL